MSDVPAAALWTLAWAMSLRQGIAASVAAGTTVALAILVRPNLAPLALALAWLQYAPPELVAPRTRWSRLVLFAGSAAIGPVLLAWSQWALFGHPLSVGYPGAEAFYQVAHIAQNLVIYPRLLLAEHGPWLFFGLLLPLVWCIVEPRPPREASRAAWSAVAVAALTVAIYLPYLPYDNRLFLRFMLPALVALFCLLSATVVLLARVARSRFRWLALLAVVPAVMVAATPLEHVADLMTIAERQRRVVAMGRYLQWVLPRRAP